MQLGDFTTSRCDFLIFSMSACQPPSSDFTTNDLKLKCPHSRDRKAYNPSSWPGGARGGEDRDDGEFAAGEAMSNPINAEKKSFVRAPGPSCLGGVREAPRSALETVSGGPSPLRIGTARRPRPPSACRPGTQGLAALPSAAMAPSASPPRRATERCRHARHAAACLASRDPIRKPRLEDPVMRLELESLTNGCFEPPKLGAASVQAGDDFRLVRCCGPSGF